jgi:ComF family protein
MAGGISFFKEILDKSIVEFFFPSRCIGCSRFGPLLCGNCINKLPWIVPPFCIKCGKPETSGDYCPSCWSVPLSIDGIRSPLRFEGNARKAVHELKYYNLKSISRLMARILFNYLQNNPLPVDMLIAVPLHKKRLHARGYNQSYLVARELGELMQLPVSNGGLIKIKDSKPQVRTANVDERRKNVENAFTCSTTLFQQKRLILIDDVCTTGATLEACSVALKSAGASSVWGLTIARET